MIPAYLVDAIKAALNQRASPGVTVELRGQQNAEGLTALAGAVNMAAGEMLTKSVAGVTVRYFCVGVSAIDGPDEVA